MLSQRRQRLIVRGIFVSVCLVPTLAIALLAVARRLPSHAAAYQQQLSAATGWRVDLQRIDHPAPGRLRAVGLHLYDPVSGRLLARIQQADWHQTEGQLHVRLTRPVLHLTRHAALSDQLLQLAAPLADAPLPAHVHCAQLTVVWDDPPADAAATSVRSFHHLQFDSVSPGSLVIAGRLPDEHRAVRVTFERPANAAPNGDATQRPVRISLEAEQPVPVAALDPQLAEALGADATFQGSGQWQWQNGRQRWEVRGTIARIAIQRALAAWSPYSLSGTGSVVLRVLTARDGRLAEANGGLVIRDGLIDRQLLAGLAARIGEVAAAPMPDDVRHVAFQRLQFEFVIAGPNLTVTPLRTETGDQPLLTGAEGAELLRIPQPHNMAVTSLIDMLVPDSQYRISATRAAQRVAALFCWPEASVQTTSVDQPPEGRIRGVHR